VALDLIGYLLFFLAGLGFGYAAPGRLKLIPFVFPVLLSLGAFARDNFQAAIVLRLGIALLVTGIGIALGYMIEQRQGREAAAH
jgi:hypothetical protein